MSWIDPSRQNSIKSVYRSDILESPIVTKQEDKPSQIVISAGAKPKLELKIEDWKDEVNQLAIDLTTLNSFQDPESVFRKSQHLVQRVNDIVEQEVGRKTNSKRIQKNIPIKGTVDFFGYRPASARIWNFFPNPFGVFAYLAENYAAARMSLDVIRREIYNDSFIPKPLEGITKDEAGRFNRSIFEFNIPFLRTEIAIHLKTYGNCFILPVKNGLGGLKELRLLYPDRMFPIYDRKLDTIVGWEYSVGNQSNAIYKVEDLLHIKIPSVKNNQLGTPPLAALVSLIEGDMYGDMLNNTVRQKGGLLKAIIGLESPSKDAPLSQREDDEDYMERVQSRIDSVFSGSRAGQSLAIMENVKGVFPLTNIGELENNFRQSKDQTSKYTAFILGVPSEKIGIQRAPNIQYVPGFTQNTLNLDFDKEMNYLMMMVDSFINFEILGKLLSIWHVRLQASGRYGAATLAAAQTINELAKSGFKVIHNEARVRILGWDELPLSDPRAAEVVTAPANRDPELTPLETAQTPEDPMFINETDENDSSEETGPAGSPGVAY